MHYYYIHIDLYFDAIHVPLLWAPGRDAREWGTIRILSQADHDVADCLAL